MSGAAPAAAAPQRALGLPIGLALVAITALGALPRILAARFNVWPHGDVVLDAAIAEALARRAQLLVPIVDVRYYPIGRFGFGYPPDQHPPLWPMLGALLTMPLGDNGYAALQVWSVLVGVLVIPFTYLAFQAALGGRGALWAAALVALSYLLVDFSGNGSLWMLLTAIFLLFIWRASVAPISSVPNAIVLGVLIGLSFLVNYPGVVLAPALVLTAGMQHGRAAASWPVVRGITVAGVVALLLALPWFGFNAAVHGNPIWSQPLQRQLGGGDKLVDVRVVDGEVVKVNRPEAGTAEARWRTTAANLYGNFGFLARQMLVLAPVFNVLAVAAVASLALPLARQASLATGREVRVLAPILAVLVCHLGLVLLWPTTKFRYLVPMLPLVLALGAWLCARIEPPSIRNLIGAIGTAGMLFMGVWTWAVIPSHTYYYNGGVVTDNFGQQGETVWFNEARQIARASDVIAARGPGTILGDHLFYALARQPLVVNSNAYSREVTEALVARYEVRYVWLERTRLEEVRLWLGGALVHEDGRFALLDLR